MLVGPVGSSEPTGRVQPAIVSDNHRAPVRKRYRSPWLQSWRVEVRERVLRERVLGLSAVWPSGSGRMASGIWPCGLWTLAAWRYLISHARLGLRSNQGRMVCNLPGPCPTPVPEPQWCPMCPHPAGLRLPFWRAFMVLSLHWWLRATSHGGRRRKCDVRYWIQHVVRWARQPDRKRFRD